MKHYFSIILLLFFFGFVSAQSPSQIKKQLKDAGITSDQAKQMARDQGYNNSQIESEIKSLNINEGSTPDNSTNPSTDIDNTIFEPEEQNIDSDELVHEALFDTLDNPLDFFGYNVFYGDPRHFQSSTFGAVDPEYIIGPGDQVIVMLWGESQFRQEFTIDREGYVFVPEVGQVFVNGLNLETLENKFYQIFSKVYSTLNPSKGKPTTFIDISLGNLRPLRIIVLGELAQPGAYSVSPSTSLSTSLYYFNGPSKQGSLRDIRLLRKGKLVGSIDFYDYLLSGNTPNDLRLQLDDVVFIPPRGKTVNVIGQVNRPGIFELKQSEGLIDVLSIAGNLSASAYTNRAQIKRIIPPDKREKFGMDRMVIDINLQNIMAQNKKIELFDGDIFEIFSISDLEQNSVSINSLSIMRPGKYQLVPEMRVSDLINAGEGLLNDAYLPLAHIKRINDDLTNELIDINLVNAIEGNLNDDLKLKYMDELIIYNKNNLKNIFTNVSITGPIKNAGSYELETGKSLGDLIISAGGFNKGINKVKIVIARLNYNSFNPIIYSFPSLSSNGGFIKISFLDDPENEINKFKLKPYDIVNVYADPMSESPKLVTILGAVHFPGSYPIISKNEKVSDIILRSGGIMPQGYPMASNFIRNGKTIRLSFEEIIDNPRSRDNFIIMPNDSIIINTRSNSVKVTGEVNQPGIYKFYDRTSVNDYIGFAGGLTNKAERKEIWINYPDGTSKQFKNLFFNPKVFDGSEIFIGIKEESEPFDVTEYAKEVTSILANLAQVLLLYSAINNN